MREITVGIKKPVGLYIKLTGIKSIIALLFLVILFLVALFTGGRLPYIILYIYGFSLLFSLLWAVISVSVLHTYIKVDKVRAMVGDSIEMTIDIENNSLLPIPFITIDASLLSNMLEHKHIFRHASLAFRQSLGFADILQCNHYGFYSMDSIALHVQDAFGIFSLTKKFSSHLMLRIYPRWYPLSPLVMFSYQQTGQISGKQRLMEDFADIGGIRLYRQGDSIKRVHWKLSAKRDELLVKDFVLNSSTQVCIVMNTYKDDYENDTERLSERVAECVASILYHCLGHDIYTGLIFNETERVVLWGNNISMFNAFMDTVIKTKMNGTMPIAKVLVDEIVEVPWGTTVLVLTPILSADVLAIMALLKNKGYEIRCIYFGDERSGEQLNAIAYLKEHGIQTFNFSISRDASSTLIAI